MELPANNGDNVIYHLEEAYRSIGDAFQLADKLGLELRIGDWLTRPLEPATKILKHTTCIRPWMYIAVGYNGQIGLCDCHTSPSSLHGARFSDGPLEEIWNGEDYQNVRRAMAVGISEIARLDTGCSKCALRKLVDFDEEIYPAASKRIVSNRYPGLLKG